MHRDEIGGLGVRLLLGGGAGGEAAPEEQHPALCLTMTEYGYLAYLMPYKIECEVRKESFPPLARSP